MTITSGPNLGLMINAALAEQYYTEMVRFLRGLDGLIQPNVNSRVANLPTTGLVEGSRYLNTTDNKIYRYTNYLNPAAWESFTPVDGWSVWSTQDQKLFRFKGGAWAVDAGAGGGFTNPMTDPGDLIVGGTGGEPIRLAKGAAGKILSATASGLAWIDAPSGGGGSAEKYTAISPSSNALALTDAATTVWGVNLSSNAAITLPTSTGILGLAIIFTQDSTGNRTVTWPSSITWNGGSAPALSTAAGSKTMVSLLSVDGGATWLGLPLTVASGGSSGSFTGGKLTSALDEADSVAFSFAGGELPISSIPANTAIVNPGGGSALTGMSAMSSGVRRILKFNYNGLAVTHDATKFIMPGGVTVSTTIGDVAEFLSLGGGNWFCLWYTKYDGKPLVTGVPATQPVTRLYSQNPVNLGATTSPVVNFVYYDNTVSSFGTATSGTERTLIRTGSDGTDPLANANDNGPITLVHSANLRLPGGANIVMGIGDSAKFVSLGSGVWVCEWFKKADGSTPVTKLRAATLDTTPVDGKFEYDGTDLYFVVGTTRKKVTLT